MLIFGTPTAQPQHKRPRSGRVVIFRRCALGFSKRLVGLEVTFAADHLKKDKVLFDSTKMKGKKLLYYRLFLFSACSLCEAAKVTRLGL